MDRAHRITAYVVALVAACLVAAAFMSARTSRAQTEQAYAPSFFRVAMFDDTFGLAVSDRSIWRTVDGGATWDERQVIARAPLPNQRAMPAAHAQYSDIGIADARHAWVVGLSGMIWHTDDAGVSWREQEAGIALHLNGVAAINTDEAWISAAGYGLGGWGVPDVRGTGTMLHTMDGGATWKEEHLTSTSNGFEFVRFVDRQTGFVVGSTCRWTGGAVLDGPNFECRNERLLATTDGGRSWQDRGELFGDSYPISMQPITLSDVVFLRFAGCPRYSADAGVNWRWMCGGMDNVYSSALTFIDPEHGWLLTWESTDRMVVRLYETSDGGRAWTLKEERDDWYGGSLPIRVSFGVTSSDVVLPAGSAGIYLVSRASNESRPAALYPLGGREVAARVSADGVGRTRYALVVFVAAFVTISLAGYLRWRPRRHQ